MEMTMVEKVPAIKLTNTSDVITYRDKKDKNIYSTHNLWIRISTFVSIKESQHPVFNFKKIFWKIGKDFWQEIQKEIGTSKNHRKNHPLIYKIQSIKWTRSSLINRYRKILTNLFQTNTENFEIQFHRNPRAAVYTSREKKGEITKKKKKTRLPIPNNFST